VGHSKVLNKNEILEWNQKYDRDDPWWVQKEKEIGDRLRKTKTLTKKDLFEVVDWKFNKLVGRKNRISKFINNNNDLDIQRTCNQVFSLTPRDDKRRIDDLDRLEGAGSSIASVILSFYDPKNYGVHDIHVWREFFGPEPTTIFTGSGGYLKLLAALREQANKYVLDARIVEKAYFKKNLEESSHMAVI
jgi:hypothetical protein